MFIKQLIFEHWQKIENKRGDRVTLKQLAGMIGIEYSYFNHIYNERRPPTEEQIDALYDYFHDPRFYDAAGLPRPDFTLRLVIKNWGQMSQTTRRKIAKIVGVTDEKDNNTNHANDKGH